MLATVHANVADQAAAADAITNTATVYLVQVSGKGWGVSSRASLALKTQSGVDKILLSGLRATVVMKDGMALDQVKTEQSLNRKSLKLVSFKKDEIVIPEAGYVLAVTGTGWADTNEKARVALEKLDNVAAAYVNRGITLHLIKAGDLDQDSVANAIAPFRMNIKDTQPLVGKPF
jgi:hypothetical protein